MGAGDGKCPVNDLEIGFKGSLARNIFSSDYAHLATGHEGYIDEKIQNPLH